MWFGTDNAGQCGVAGVGTHSVRGAAAASLDAATGTGPAAVAEAAALRAEAVSGAGLWAVLGALGVGVA